MGKDMQSLGSHVVITAPEIALLARLVTDGELRTWRFGVWFVDVFVYGIVCVAASAVESFSQRAEKSGFWQFCAYFNGGLAW
ncbi:hypothetical protein G4O51_04205 [Candidatus Bathyarchaeota archaeon A05DMB-2]|jgi:hypothetical protein|nr:hypothetical protein [Candidatus Bathyarchaeota archaeon A05DMB-2]